MDSDRTIILEKHIVDAWGLWYLEWQATKKDIIKKQAQSPKEFINKHLVAELILLDIWNSDTRTELIANNGSVATLNIPDSLKQIYKTVWEIPQKVLINMSADRGPFICQSQSLNLFIADPSYSKLTSMHFYAWKQGLKTGCYYLRTKGASAPQQFTIEPCSMCTA